MVVTPDSAEILKRRTAAKEIWEKLVGAGWNVGEIYYLCFYRESASDYWLIF